MLKIVPLLPWLIEAYKYETRFFDQKVDHFNFQISDTFKQKLLVNYDYYNETGPIFFYTGNEGPIEGFADNTGFMFELAEKHRAAIVFAEHRYYGSSLPYGEEKSFSPSGIGYLSIEQALADFAVIIQGYLPNKVIAFGGSYGGMLSAYMRQSYPHLVYGAVSASTPIIWLNSAKPQYPTMFQGVTSDYSRYNPGCAAKIKAGFDMNIGIRGDSTQPNLRPIEYGIF